MAVSGGNVEEAAQLMLYRQEMGEGITPEATKSKVSFVYLFMNKKWA